MSLIISCLLLTLFVHLSIIGSDETVNFALTRLAQANVTGKLVPCTVGYDGDVSSEEQCRNMCKVDAKCVYFVYKEQQECDTIQGCHACLTERVIPVTEVAKGRKTQQSTTHNHIIGNSSKAVDGNKGQAYSIEGCAHTEWQSDPWWSVTLDSVKSVKWVTIYNRGECCGERLHDFNIYGSDNAMPIQGMRFCAHHTGKLRTSEIKTVHCDTPVSALHVIIQIPGDKEILTVCEVEVFATDITPSSQLSVLNVQDFVHVKLGICEHLGLCPTAKDCSELKALGYHISGLYPIKAGPGDPISVYCDMYTDGGGWTVFQRRMDGSVDFYRNWSEYEVGFGNLSGEFWLGNANISSLTSKGEYVLRVDLQDFEFTSVYAEYGAFKLDASDSYRASIGSYEGNAGNSLGGAFGVDAMKFSAKDMDLDTYKYHCAVLFKGAWWYSGCHSANLNAQYLRGPHTTHADGVNWYAFRGHYYSLKFTEMKIRPALFKPPIAIYPFVYGSTTPRDCSDYRYMGFIQSGVYPVTTRKGRKFDVYCDMETANGGWMVFQRRKDGTLNFTRKYTDYVTGFGHLTEEFWLGNDKLAAVTEQGSYELRVDLEDFEGNKRFANYDVFSINREDKYRLWLGMYSGDAGDSLTYHNQHRWSTFDDDNDEIAVNCAFNNKGGWWYNYCLRSNLNGLYLKGQYHENPAGKGVVWNSFKGLRYSLKFTEMKVRRAGYKPPN